MQFLSYTKITFCASVTVYSIILFYIKYALITVIIKPFIIYTQQFVVDDYVLCLCVSVFLSECSKSRKVLDELGEQIYVIPDCK